MVKGKLFLKLGLVISFTLCLAQLCEAKVKLPTLISDGMVLQRDQSISIWGTADAGEEVTVTFRKKKYTTQASINGNWKVTLPPTRAGGPYTITVNEITVSNILIGDVYLLSGQSNMELPIRRVTDLYADEVSNYSNPMIRHIKVPLAYNFHEPQTDIRPAAWKDLNPVDGMEFSAVAYFMAKEMFEKNGVPVGLLNSAVGGSPVEAWISEEALKPFPKYLNEKHLYENDELNNEVRQIENKRSSLWTSVLYEEDKGLHEPVKWYAAGYDDTQWNTTELFDSSWNNNGLNAINGSFWFRKNIELTQEFAGKDAVLRLGCIVDADSVFVNGTFVGTTSYQYPPRIYKIPGHLLKPGKNNITVRLISYGGRARFVPEKPYKLIIGSNEISLEGEWKYRIGTPMPPMPGGTTLQYKPTGLYNSMIAPLENLRFTGAVWYQGESNTGRYNEYYGLLTTLIADWRTFFQQHELPFVIVELAEFGRPDGWGAFREVQKRVATDTPHTALAPAKDLGEWNDIHPLRKKDLGIRVATQMEQLTKSNTQKLKK